MVGCRFSTETDRGPSSSVSSMVKKINVPTSTRLQKRGSSRNPLNDLRNICLNRFWRLREGWWFTPCRPIRGSIRIGVTPPTTSLDENTDLVKILSYLTSTSSSLV